MALLDFNQGAADAWVAKAEELNNRCDTYVKAVGACLQEIKSDSVGDMVDDLALAGAQVIDASAQLMSSLSAIVSGVRNIFTRLLQAAAEMVADVDANKGTITKL